MPRKASLSMELLETFLSVLRHDGNAAEAARELELNQPSMSKRLSFLQHAGHVLARPWLVREGKTWRLTDEGSRVRPAVEEIVRRLQLLRHAAAGPATPGVSLACGQQAAATFVRDALVRFREGHPDVRVRLSTPRGQVRIEGVADGSLDLALVTHDHADVVKFARRDRA